MQGKTNINFAPTMWLKAWWKEQTGAHFARRLIGMLISVVVMGFGLSLLILVDWGADSFAFANLNIARKTGTLLGTWQLATSGILLIAVVLTDRKLIGLGTIGNMVMVGYCADFFGYLWKQVPFLASPLPVWGRLLILIPTLAVFVVSAAAYMTANLGMAPYDAIPFIVADKLPKVPFRVIRMLWDALFICLGLLLGGTLGLVTVLIALCVGPVVSLFRNTLSKKLYLQ